MSNTKISQLTLADALTGDEVLPIVQTGSTRKTTVQDIADLAAGGASIFPVTGTGTATGDVTGNLGGHVFHISDGSGNDYLVLDPTPDAENATLQTFNIASGNGASFNLNTNHLQASFSLALSDFASGFAYGHINGTVNATTSAFDYDATTHTFNDKVGVGVIPNASVFAVVGLQDFANNAAAITGGLNPGDFYLNGDISQIVH